MSVSKLPSFLTHAAAVSLVAMVLVAAGQPLFTDDTWWHLALGRAYLAEGVWLHADPLLFTAPGPPATASWLFDVALYGVDRLAGFAGLRVVHVAIVAGILALAWSTLRRASGSAFAASALTVVFTALSAYRLVQLRPHLLTIVAALVLYRLLLERDASTSRIRNAAAVALLAVWVNVHAGFMLGPILMLAALSALLLTAALRGAQVAQRARVRSIAVAIALGVLATLLNPGGLDPHFAYFAAGSDTPSLGRVGDEWARIALFSWPDATTTPNPLSWAIIWALLLATGLAGFAAVRRWLRGNWEIDPVSVALAAVGVVGMLTAVRFVWLGVFPLLLVARWIRLAQPVPAATWATALAVIASPPLFVSAGDWPRLTRAFTPSWASYRQPYPAQKWFAHAVWLLDDAGLEGNLFNDYFTGGFVGYWVSPGIRSFINGTLNVTIDVIDSNRPIRERRGVRDGEDFTALLDRHGVDLFFGIRLPETLATPGTHYATTTLLEGEPGWIRVFRNLDSAVYLRANARNAHNLSRVSDYYAAERVPFDPETGFDPETVIRKASLWALSHGLVPVDFRQLTDQIGGSNLDHRRYALGRVASIYAALGMYERSIVLDRRLLSMDDGDTAALERSEWSQTRLDRNRERAAPLFTPVQANALRRGFVPPSPRTDR